MRVAGIDLAAQPKTTAVCVIEDGVVTFAASGCDDDAIERAVEGCSKVGIDAPFGWPTAFVDAVCAHRAREPWPEIDDRALRLRHTDRFVHAELGLTPLSVSTDRIGIVAFRCARLLGRFGESDRSGGGRLCEVYPAAALRRWYGDGVKGYRGDAGRRAALLERLGEHTGLEAGDDLPLESDHVFDAVVSALVALAVTRGETAAPDDVRLAAEEGWIHIPRAGAVPPRV